MNNRISGNQMTMAHFHDFYFLEALQAGLSMAKIVNPEFQFRRSVEKLESDINETFENLTHTMALRIYVYLYAASLGEARHASDNCDTAIEEVDGVGRSRVYNKALQYFPSDKNVNILLGIFSQNWNSNGFGGEAWLEIVEGMTLYGTITDAAFIDHTVDLEHNSGSVFTKDTDDEINFQCFGSYDANTLKGFLNWKFRSDILNEKKSSYSGRYDVSFDVSSKIYNLMIRYSNIIAKIEAVNYCSPTLEFLTPYEVDWGTQEFSITECDPESDWPECEWCSNKIDPEDHKHYQHACICDDCYRRKVTFCDHCGDECVSENTVAVDCEMWCEGCASNDASQCEDCGNYTQEYTTTTDAGQTFCQDCIKNNATKCECGDWVSDMETHDAENHPEPTYDTPLVVDADGIFEIMPEYPETEYTIIYKWFQTGMTFETRTKTPHQQIESLKTAGAYMAKIKKTYAYAEIRKTFDINTYGKTATITLNVYDIPNSGLFVFNRRMAQKRIGGSEVENEYAVMTPLGLWTNGNDKSLDGALETLYNIKDLLDWKKFTDVRQWQSLPESKLEEIKQAIYGG